MQRGESGSRWKEAQKVPMGPMVSLKLGQGAHEVQWKVRGSVESSVVKTNEWAFV